MPASAGEGPSEAAVFAGDGGRLRIPSQRREFPHQSGSRARRLMAVRPVLLLPDPMLQRPSAKVGTVEAQARALATDLLDTMRARPACVGLAAPQIGVGLRAFAIDVSGHRNARSCSGELVLFDPELLSASAPAVAREGCLSIPDLTGDVARATEVVVRGIGVDGAERVVEADAFEARALLHELDHLDGLLFLDRVASAHSVYRRKVYR